MRNERIEVSQVLDLQPRLFSLPATIIVPILFLVGLTTMICWMLAVSVYMTILTAITFNCAYFFLFGQEWWRLIVKFKRPPRWVRADVDAIPFAINRHEIKTKRSQHRASKRQTA